MERSDLQITAARASIIYDALINARNDVNSQMTVYRQAIIEKRAALKAMVKRISSLVKELSHLLDPMDSRWLSFGLNIPGTQQTPEAPANVTIARVTPNAIDLKWDAAARARYYRVWAKWPAQEEFTAMGSPTDCDFTIENIPAQTSMEIVVTALNNGGESVRSDTITAVTPPFAHDPGSGGMLSHGVNQAGGAEGHDERPKDAAPGY